MHRFAMRCNNCGAPLEPTSSGQCGFCGVAQTSKPAPNDVGALVEQLIGQAKREAGVSTSVKLEDVRLVQTTFSVNGTQYDSLEQVPPEFREAVSRGLAIAGQLGNTHTAGATTPIAAAPYAKGEREARGRSPKSAARWLIIASLLVAVLLALTAIVTSMVK